MAKRGRPSDYDAKRVAAEITKYLSACKAHSYLPTVEGLAVHLCVGRSTLTSSPRALTREIILAGTTVQYASTATQRSEVASNMTITADEIKQAVRTLKQNNAQKITEMIDPSRAPMSRSAPSHSIPARLPLLRRAP